MKCHGIYLIILCHINIKLSMYIWCFVYNLSMYMLSDIELELPVAIRMHHSLVLSLYKVYTSSCARASSKCLFLDVCKT